MLALLGPVTHGNPIPGLAKRGVSPESVEVSDSFREILTLMLRLLSSHAKNYENLLSQVITVFIRKLLLSTIR